MVTAKIHMVTADNCSSVSVALTCGNKQGRDLFVHFRGHMTSKDSTEESAPAAGRSEPVVTDLGWDC